MEHKVGDEVVIKSKVGLIINKKTGELELSGCLGNMECYKNNPKAVGKGSLYIEGEETVTYRYENDRHNIGTLTARPVFGTRFIEIAGYTTKKDGGRWAELFYFEKEK